MNRRRFLEFLGSMAAAAALPIGQAEAHSIPGETNQSSEAEFHWRKPEWLDLDRLQPNPAANMGNMVVVPERLYRRTNRETVKMAVDYRTTFNPINPAELLNDLWGYGQAVRDALQRGQTVWLVLDLPDDYSVDLPSLAMYFEALACRFTVVADGGGERTARFVIGNELNARQQTSEATYLQWYAQAYLTAVRAIRQVHAEAELYPASDAYFGNGEVLVEMLRAIQVADTEVLDLNAVVSGLGFHFYDNHSKLVERTAVYATIARAFSLDPNNLHLLELGKAESDTLGFSVFDHQQVIIRNLVTVLAFQQLGKIQTAIWHTAESVVDPHDHALFVHDGDRFEPKPQYATFELISKLLYRILRFEEHEHSTGIYQVTCEARTSNNDQVIVTWNRFRDSRGQIVGESEPIITVGLSGSKLSRRELFAKPWSSLVQQ